MSRSIIRSCVALSRGSSFAVSGHTARYGRKAFAVRATTTTGTEYDLLAQAGAVLLSPAPIGEEERRLLLRIVFDTSIALARNQEAAARDQAAAARDQAAVHQTVVEAAAKKQEAFAAERLALTQRLCAAQMTATRALHSAGVVDGRRLLGKPPRTAPSTLP